MNKDQLEKRITELGAMEQQVQQQLVNAQAQLNALAGAKQDCIFWIAKLSENSPAKAKKRKSKEISKDVA